MVTDKKKAKTVLGIQDSAFTSEDVEIILFLSKKQLEQTLVLTENKEVSSIASKRLGLVDTVLNENAEVQLSADGYSEDYDEIVCNEVIDRIDGRKLTSYEIQDCISKLAKCKCALSMYLTSILILRLEDSYDNAVKALEYSKLAYQTEPNNLAYASLCLELQRVLESISNQKIREAEARKRAAEEQKRYAEQQEEARRQTQRKIEEDREKERNKQIIKNLAIVLIIIILLASCH